MTDNENLKALEWCEQFENNIVMCGRHGEKYTYTLQMMQIIKQALKGYNRQQAEIERLNASIKEVNEYLSEGDFAKGISLIIRLVKEMKE